MLDAVITENTTENPATGCWEWQARKNAGGYGVLCARRFGFQTTLAHRIIFFWSEDCPEDDRKVLHKCDNPSCVNPAHLFGGTQADNMRDMFSKGRGKPVAPRDNRGSRNPLAKLNEQKVREIRDLIGTMPQAQIARRYGVSQSVISRIKGGKRWLTAS